MKVPAEVRCIIITSIFPPLNGGSAVVYENLCRHAPPGTMYALTVWRDYSSGNLIEEWKEYDGRVSYPIKRIELLRPRSIQSKSKLHSLWSLIVHDIPLKISIAIKVFKVIRENNINIICIGELNSGSWIGLLCRSIFDCKVINYIHGEEITSTTTYLLYGRNREFYLKKADAIVAVSQFTRDALISLMHVDQHKIHVIENGVDTEKFYPGPKRPEILNKYNLTDKIILLTVGRLVERKGIDKTIQALPEIIKSIPNIHYIIVGTGEFGEKLERMVVEMGLQNFVTFTGRVGDDEIVKFYQTCDLFVMPNRELADRDTEGFGLVFLEANACMKTVIGGRAGGAVEAVKHETTGLLVDGNDPNEIASAVLRILKNPNLRLRMEKQGYKLASNANWQNKAHLFYQLCQKLLRGD